MPLNVVQIQKIVSLKMKSVVMVSCMYIHLYPLWGQHLGRMPLQNTICVEVCKKIYSIIDALKSSRYKYKPNLSQKLNNGNYFKTFS